MDDDISKSNELLIINNIINLIIKIKDNCFDDDFKYYFISIARSYLSNLNDEEIFDIFSNDNFKNNSIYEKFKPPYSPSHGNFLIFGNRQKFSAKILNGFKYLEYLKYLYFSFRISKFFRC